MSLVTMKSRKKPTPRRRAPEIMDAVARIFAERGFHGATTQDIADVLGIRQASLYYYFASKEAALEKVCLKGVEGFVEAAQTIAASPGTCTNRLMRLIDSHLSPLIDRGDFMRCFLNERQYLPAESRRRVGKLAHELERIFEDVIKEGVRNGEFRNDIDPRVTTLAILGMANTVPQWYRREDIPISRISREFGRLIVAGVQSASNGRPSGRPRSRG